MGNTILQNSLTFLNISHAVQLPAVVVLNTTFFMYSVCVIFEWAREPELRYYNFMVIIQIVFYEICYCW